MTTERATKEETRKDFSDVIGSIENAINIVLEHGTLATAFTEEETMDVLRSLVVSKKQFEQLGK